MDILKYLAGPVLALCLGGCSNSAPLAQAGPSAQPGGGLVTTGAAGTGAAPNDPANTVIMELKTGKVTLQLRPDLAPKHVERFKTLTSQGFYDGLKFHRVIPGFMAQTGDPQGTGAGGSSLPDLPAEFSGVPFERGTLGAARQGHNKNSANSQFFITFTHAPHLNGDYTVFGKVVDGMQHVDQIAKGEPPPNPDTIAKMYLATAAP